MQPSPPRRILLMDDDAAMRLIVVQFLRKEGYEVRDLDSGDQLDTAIEQFSPDAVVSDVMMPGQDGVTLCKRLRSDPRTSHIPVILISAKFFDSDKSAALAAGAAAYLVKPFKLGQLSHVLTEALSTSATLWIWGCRGSIPAPERACGSYGANTSCVEIILPQNHKLIFDAGTGIRLLGKSPDLQSPQHLSLFLTHYHWDHIQGFPFFIPLYVPGNEIDIHGPASTTEDLVATISQQMGGAFFPVSMDAFQSRVKFIALQQESRQMFGASLSTFYAFHPGRTLAYRVDIGSRSIVYIPDNELLPEDTQGELRGEALRMAQFVSGATLLLHDCQYSREDYEKHRGWGHSCGETLGALAAQAGVERVLLFHHDPDSTDEHVNTIADEFQKSLSARGGTASYEPAREGSSYEL